MKNIILLSLLSIVLLSCNKDENKEFNGNIVGMSYTNQDDQIYLTTFSFISDKEVKITAKTFNGKDLKGSSVYIYSKEVLSNNSIKIIIPDIYTYKNSSHYFTGIIAATGKEMVYTGSFNPLYIIIGKGSSSESVSIINEETVFYVD